jgi:hypothetical protein
VAVPHRTILRKSIRTGRHRLSIVKSFKNVWKVERL